MEDNLSGKYGGVVNGAKFQFQNDGREINGKVMIIEANVVQGFI